MALKGLHPTQHGRFRLRKLTLAIQFSVTLLLMISIITILSQLHHMKAVDPGFNKDQVIVFDFFTNRFREKDDLLKKSFSQNPNILNMSKTNTGVPGKSARPPFFTLDFDGHQQTVLSTSVDPNYLDILDLNIKEGRFFEEKISTDQFDYRWTEGVLNIVVNESAAKLFRFENPVGKSGRWVFYEHQIKIIGVIEDFHLDAPNKPIPPMFFFWGRGHRQMVRIKEENMASTLQFVGEEVEKLIDHSPEIEFIDRNFARQYGDDENFARLISYLTVVVIIISAMGLLGVFMHTIKLRIKEIGIRKVMGASLPQIIRLLTLPIVKTIVISSLIAIPIGAIAMRNWLANYPYRIELDWTIFAMAIGSTLLIAMLTIGWQCWQASNQNPARLIRYE